MRIDLEPMISSIKIASYECYSCCESTPLDIDGKDWGIDQWIFPFQARDLTIKHLADCKNHDPRLIISMKMEIDIDTQEQRDY